MLARLRRNFRLPRIIRAMKTFNLTNTRNLCPECISGHQTLLDLPRSTIRVNRSLVNSNAMIDNYRQHNPEILQSGNHRTALHIILEQSIFENSGIHLNPSLVDELLTLLHQACLYGSIYNNTLIKLIQDIKDMPDNGNTDPMPILEWFASSIKVLSENTVHVKYKEQGHFTDMLTTDLLCLNVYGELSFNITSHFQGRCHYHNARLEILIPSPHAEHILSPSLIRISNTFSTIKNFFTRLCSRIKNFFTRQPVIYNTQEENKCEFEYNSQAGLKLSVKLQDMVCDTVTSADILQTRKEARNVCSLDQSKDQEPVQSSTLGLPQVTGVSQQQGPSL